MKRFNKIFSTMLVIAMLFASSIIPDVSVQADDVHYITLQTDDTWVSGTINASDDANYYAVTTSQTGWLTVTYQGGSIERADIDIMNYDMTNTYKTDSVSGSSSTNLKTSSWDLALEPGTYIIKISGFNSFSNYPGDYRIKASFKTASNNETADNNDFATAQKLSFGASVNGFISLNDKVDFYQFTLSSRREIRILYTSYIKSSYMEIYNKDFISVSEKDVSFASEGSPLTYEYKETLEPGTYYIKIYPSYDYCGRYILQLKENVLTKSISISGKTTVVAGKKVQLSAAIAPSNVTDSSIRWTSGDTYIASVNENTGLVTTYRPGVVNITATARDGSNVSKTYTIIVKPKKMSAPKLSSTKSKKMTIRFSAQANVKGYQIQYSTNKKFKGAKTKKVTKPNVTLKSLKKKKTYYVRVRAYIKKGSKTYYGDWSKTKKIKVK